MPGKFIQTSVSKNYRNLFHEECACVSVVAGVTEAAKRW